MNQSTPSARCRQRRKHGAPSALSTFPLSFGRYRNVPLSRIPAAYLRWLVTAENIPDGDRWAAERYLEAVATRRRRRPGRRHPPGRLQESTTPTAGTVGAGN